VFNFVKISTYTILFKHLMIYCFRPPISVYITFHVNLFVLHAARNVTVLVFKERFARFTGANNPVNF
jgi:hypothetical protein